MTVPRFVGQWGLEASTTPSLRSPRAGMGRGGMVWSLSELQSSSHRGRQSRCLRGCFGLSCLDPDGSPALLPLGTPPLGRLRATAAPPPSRPRVLREPLAPRLARAFSPSSLPPCGHWGESSTAARLSRLPRAAAAAATKIVGSWVARGCTALGQERKGFARRGMVVIPAAPRPPGIFKKFQASVHHSLYRPI